jgi:hypothetical protein
MSMKNKLWNHNKIKRPKLEIASSKTSSVYKLHKKKNHVQNVSLECKQIISTKNKILNITKKNSLSGNQPTYKSKCGEYFH